MSRIGLRMRLAVRSRRMLVRRLAILLRRLGMSLGLVVLPLFVMMGRLVMVVSSSLMCRGGIVMMLVRRMLSHTTILSWDKRKHQTPFL
jgi:hypothetical protein